ncbi:preprotein translocase subunit SecG [archaeon]|jgi:hypothetical protein|nr:preprotein translocase subunit SecG [archaeon]
MEREDRALIISILLVVLIVIAVLLVGFVLYLVFRGSGGFLGIAGNVIGGGENCKYVSVPYHDVESYVVREPYSYEETYYEKGYSWDYDCDSRRLRYRREIVECDGGSSSNKVRVECDVKNRDSKSGDFSVKFGIKCVGGGCSGSDYDKETLDIRSGSTESVSGIFDVGSGDIKCFCDVTPEKRRVCDYDRDYRMIPKTKLVTKYKDVVKTKSVVKYKAVEKCE